MYFNVNFNVNFNVFFKLIKVHLLVSELYIGQSHFAKADQPKTTSKDYGTEIWRRVFRSRLTVSDYLQPPSSGYFYPGDGGSMLSRNVS